MNQDNTTRQVQAAQLEGILGNINLLETNDGLSVAIKLLAADFSKNTVRVQIPGNGDSRGRKALVDDIRVMEMRDGNIRVLRHSFNPEILDTRRRNFLIALLGTDKLDAPPFVGGRIAVQASSSATVDRETLVSAIKDMADKRGLMPAITTALNELSERSPA